MFILHIINTLQNLYKQTYIYYENKLNVWANLCKTGLAIMAVSAFVSCGNNKEFTSGRAEDAIEDLPMFQDSANVTTLKVGYYEENDAAVRYKLRQLAANEMLTYSAEQINEYIPASYWNRAKTKEHVFITVSLTEKVKNTSSMNLSKIKKAKNWKIKTRNKLIRNPLWLITSRFLYVILKRQKVT